MSLAPPSFLGFEAKIHCIEVGRSKHWPLFSGVSPPGDFHNVDGSLLSKLLSAKQSAYRGPAWYLSLMKENTLGPSKAWLDPSGM